jgi:hypothetical protein
MQNGMFVFDVLKLLLINVITVELLEMVIVLNN